jgi:nicotinate-nucleotide adenylyltransferase
MAFRRVAIYGGTFDPVHLGHVEVARRVLKLFELDEVIFVPACVPPHKRNAHISSAFHRFAMIALATEQDQNLRVSTVELDAPQFPYAVETIERMKNGSERLFFLIGADSWAEISTWHEWRKLLKMCDVIVVTRPGHEIGENAASPFADLVDLRDADQATVMKLIQPERKPRVFITNVAMVDVSATEIRAAVQSNDLDKLKMMVPPAVASYIKKYNLYGN